MKQLAITILVIIGISAGPVMADHEHRDLLSRENLGGAIGAAIGGFAGSKIVKGKGRPAATAAATRSTATINNAHVAAATMAVDIAYIRSTRPT